MPVHLSALYLVYRFNGYCNWIICTIHNFDDRLRICTRVQMHIFWPIVKLPRISFFWFLPLVAHGFWERIPMVLKSLRHYEDLWQVVGLFICVGSWQFAFTLWLLCKSMAVEQWSKVRLLIWYLMEEKIILLLYSNDFCIQFTICSYENIGKFDGSSN